MRVLRGGGTCWWGRRRSNGAGADTECVHHVPGQINVMSCYVTYPGSARTSSTTACTKAVALNFLPAHDESDVMMRVMLCDAHEESKMCYDQSYGG